MKKFFLLVITSVLILSLSGCFIIREKILAPPDQMEIPDGSKQAICVKDDTSYKYIYQLDGVYQFFINDVLQDDEALNHEQEQATLHNESVYNYLMAEYGITNCTITDYVDTTKTD